GRSRRRRGRGGQRQQSAPQQQQQQPAGQPAPGGARRGGRGGGPAAPRLGRARTGCVTAPAIRLPVAGVLFDYGDTLIAIERPEAALLEAYTRISELLRHAGFAAPDGDALL